MRHNLSHLQSTGLVAETGSFSAAARALGVSQPTVSTAVASVEELLGAKLFRRTTRRVELTSFGQAVLPHISDVLNSALALDHHAAALLNPEKKLVRVACSPLVDSRRLMALLESFARDTPDVEVVFKECNVDDLESRLDSEQADVICGIHLRKTAARGRCTLYRDALRLIPAGGLAQYHGPAEVPLRQLAHSTVLLTAGHCGLAPATRELFRSSRTALRAYAGQALSYQSLQEWAELGVGVALLPQSRLAGDAKLFPLITIGALPIQLMFEAVWNRHSMSSGHLNACLHFLKRASATMADAQSWSR